MALSTCERFKCTAHLRGLELFGENYQYGHGAVLVGHKCLVFGGYADYKDATKRVYVFDTKTGAWDFVHVSQQPLAFGTSRIEFILRDVLTVYIFTEPDKRYSLLELDLVEMEEWNLVEDRASPRLGEGTAGCFFESRNEMVAFGGRDTGTEVFRYSVDRKVWLTAKTSGFPPNPRANHATCSSGLVMFVIGGSLNGTNMQTLDMHALNVARLPFTWSTPKYGTFRPPRRFLFHASYIGDRIILYGGFNKTRHFCFYSIKERRWFEGVRRNVEYPDRQVRFESNWSSGTSAYAVAHTNEKMWLFGGFEMKQKWHLEIEPM